MCPPAGARDVLTIDRSICRLPALPIYLSSLSAVPGECRFPAPSLSPPISPLQEARHHSDPPGLQSQLLPGVGWPAALLPACAPGVAVAGWLRRQGGVEEPALRAVPRRRAACCWRSRGRPPAVPVPGAGLAPRSSAGRRRGRPPLATEPAPEPGRAPAWATCWGPSGSPWAAS